jgi:hypothetical protein
MRRAKPTIEGFYFLNLDLNQERGLWNLKARRHSPAVKLQAIKRPGCPDRQATGVSSLRSAGAPNLFDMDQGRLFESESK